MATTKPVATFPAKTAQAPAVAAGPMSGKGVAALVEATTKPARKAAAKPAAKAPAVVAKSGKLFAAAADGVPGAGRKPAAKKAAATKAPAKPRSAAAKRAEPAPMKKVATKAAKPATAPAAVKPAKGEPTQHTVKNVKELIKFLSTMPAAGGFDVDRKFGKAKIQVMNIRGRVIAEVTKAK